MSNLSSIKSINSTPSCLKIITRDGKLLKMTPQGLGLIESPDLETVFGANVYDIVEASHREKFINFNNRVCNGESGHLIFELVGLKGTRRWMETYAAPYTLTNGEVAQIAITNDITSKVNSDETILQQRQALEESARLATLGQFVSGIAHEINNPLAIIAARANLAKSRVTKGQSDPEFLTESLEKIEMMVSRVNKIINGLRSFSRDPNRDEKGFFSLSNVFNETFELCSEKFRLRNIELEVHIPKDMVIYCKDVQISQVFMNLLNNAFDAIDNLEEKWIKVEAKYTQDWVVLTITDSGKGIPEETATSMLNPFYTTKEVGHGTGLGLSICVGIIKDHDGFLNFNKEHSNTQFEIRLPNIKEEKLV